MSYTDTPVQTRIKDVVIPIGFLWLALRKVGLNLPGCRAKQVPAVFNIEVEIRERVKEDRIENMLCRASVFLVRHSVVSSLKEICYSFATYSDGCGLTVWHSPAASARDCCQNANDLAREAVSCNAGLGGNAGLRH
jgi:hypothetical protein